MWKNLGGLVGYVIGAVVLVPLLLVGFNFIYINKNDAKKYLSAYCANSVEVKLRVPYYKKSNIPNDDLFFSELITTEFATKNMGRDGSSSIKMVYRTVYDSTTRKYFQITVFEWTNYIIAINNKTILAKVNKEDLNNPVYGTKEKPVLVFSARGMDGPLLYEVWDYKKSESVEVNMDTPPDKYAYNANMYFTYIMTKTEFKKRFEGITLSYTPLIEMKGAKQVIPIVAILIPLFFLIYFSIGLAKDRRAEQSANIQKKK